MANHISTGAVNHVSLTVTDVERARDFYTGLLGFQQVAEFGPKLLLHNGSVMIAIAPAPHTPLDDDKFDENRVGLDHISFSVGSRDDLEDALKIFDERGISHGEINDLEPLKVYVLAFRDPDNIQIELTARYS